ncbi:HAMP domain-containing histidine kinase [Thermodesulfobacterium sp. TA1]|uniref:two-component system sensor histidine kinase NtrB n=1 Tax=Thermodesulfobacterium sp. TA1 TaxID=2234087 RepID=UPI00123299CA|nr:HAMP domain-containing sensor histidine kinase [Thermodesulfobacterium sp. TA1]QER41688.1 HAMP domain-containing histidine kinase [Thermodesulfobacterium sp. TA1]
MWYIKLEMKRLKQVLGQTSFKSVLILWVVLVLAIATLFLSAVFSYKNSKVLAQKALEDQAMMIAITLQGVMTYTNLEEMNYNAFLNIILSQNWENLEFIMLYDEDGDIILHSNPELIGYRLAPEEINFIKNCKLPYYRFYLDQEDEALNQKIFIADFNFYTQKYNLYLRVGLNIATFSFIIKRAQFLFSLKMLACLGLLIAGFIGTKFLIGYERMQLKMKELESISTMAKILSHEIRNPLGSIKGFSQYLREKIPDPSFSRYLEIIFREALRIERLTDELILYVNPVKVEPKNFNLKELIEEVWFSFKDKYPQVELKFFTQGENFEVVTDPDKIKEIVVNLIQNALDAVLETNQEKKEVKIEVEDYGESLRVRVVDNGPGMDEDTLKKAFDPFFTTKPKGSGLGLAIVEKLCEAMKIKINLQTQKGEGTSIWLEIPRFLS